MKKLKLNFLGKGDYNVRSVCAGLFLKNRNKHCKYKLLNVVRINDLPGWPIL